MVTLGLRNGWCIEQWSWKKSLSAAYRQLVTANRDRMRLFFIDDFYEQIKAE